MINNATSNPFLYEGPVPPDRFIGREIEINTILDLIANPARGNSAIAGEEGVGKSSLLNYISAPEVSMEWGLSPEWCIFVKIDCQTITCPTQTAFWSKVLHVMEDGLSDEELRRECEKLRTEGFITGFDLRQFFDKLAQASKLAVLLLDDFHGVIDHIDPDKPDLLTAIRALTDRPLRGLSVVTTTLNPLHTLCNDMNFGGSPFPNIFAFVQLRPFTPDQASELIDRALASTGVTFTESNRKCIYEASKGHPARLQKACYDLFEKLQQRNRDQGAEA